MTGLGALIEVLQMIPTLGCDAKLGDWITDYMAIAIMLGAVGFARKLAGSGTLSSADLS